MIKKELNKLANFPSRLAGDVAAKIVIAKPQPNQRYVPHVVEVRQLDDNNKEQVVILDDDQLDEILMWARGNS